MPPCLGEGANSSAANSSAACGVVVDLEVVP